MPLLQRLKNWALRRSIWVYHLNTGSCNGCDIEILDAFTPRYDVERFGIKLVGSPRHADVIVVTGNLTSKAWERAKRVIEQVPEPRFIVVVGSCAATGGLFQGSYNLHGPIDRFLNVDAYVFGCPARPEAIIDAFYKLIKKLEEARK